MQYLRTKMMSKMSLMIFFTSFSLISCSEYKVLLSSDEPAVLDAPIIFYGELEGVDSPDSQYRWRWFDTTSPGHFREEETNGTVNKINYTIVYPSSEMTLSIYEYDLFFWKNIGETTVKFHLTQELNGQLELSQNGQVTNSIVSSVKSTSIDVKFHDPSNFLKDADIRYFWFINTVNYGQTPTGHFEYNFTSPGEYDIEVSVIAYFDNSSLVHTHRDAVSLLYDANKNGNELLVKDAGSRPNSSVKMAIFTKKVISKQPIGNMTVGGETLLKHGALVDLNIDCSGSSPWLYCWVIKEKGYNITGNETCDDPRLLKADCEFPILWYFRNSDTYNFLVVINNDVSSHVQVIPVTIYDVASQNPVSIVIIPVVSSIIVVIIIITGVALHAHYRNRLAVEVADFDFGQADEEELQYKTFWERLRESFGAHFTSNASDVQSEGSSVSGRRSVQMPGPAGIGYGSIT